MFSRGTNKEKNEEATPLLGKDSEKSEMMQTVSEDSEHGKSVATAGNMGPYSTQQPRKISLAQLRPFFAIAIPFFREDRGAFCSLVGIVTLTLVESALLIVFSYVRRDIFDALNNKNKETFYKMIFIFFGILVIIVPISVLYDYLRLKLALYWRKELTRRVLEKYYANRSYYIIECCKEIDNPDQRICEDLTEFTTTSLNFFFIVFDAVINLVSFSAVLYQIYPLLFLAIIAYALLGTLITARLGKSLVGQYYAKLQREADFRFGLIRTRENAEGIAFYDSDASLEQVNLWNLFERVLENQLKIIRTQRNLELFTTSYDYLTFVIPYLVVSPLYFNGMIDLGSITQASEAFYYVRSDFSIIVSNFEKLSAFSAGIERLKTFIDRINEGGWQMPIGAVDMDEDNGASGLTDKEGHIGEISKSIAAVITSTARGATATSEGYHKVGSSDALAGETEAITATATATGVSGASGLGRVGEIKGRRVGMIQMITNPDADEDEVTDSGELKIRVLRCEDLTVLTPDGLRVLIGADSSTPGVLRSGGVNFQIFEGDRVLVVGPSGTGKSSLLRAISGLWELGSGRIIWNTEIPAVGGTGYRHRRLKLDDDEVGPISSVKETALEGVFFLPQKPYNLLGSLRQQVAYPSIYPGEFVDEQIKGADSSLFDGGNVSTLVSNAVRESNDAELLEILRRVKLETLAARMGGGDEITGLGVYKDWSKVLSLGEQQRLAFARLLYNRKHISVAVLDESTSALDEASEAAMYSLLADMKITYISVGHRASLYRYHSKKLVLHGPGVEVECVPIKSGEAGVDS